MLALAGTAGAAQPSSAPESSGRGGSVEKSRARPVVYRPYYRPYYGRFYGPYYGRYWRPYYGWGYGWGAGAGFAAGAGLGYFFSPVGYAYVPYSVRTYAYAPNTYTAIPAYPNAPYDDPSTYPPQAVSETGLRITEVMDGPAKQADLRVGDIILGIGQTQTQTFEELQKALAAGKGKVDLVFINHETKNVEKLPVTPINNKLGVAVVPAAVR
jgi:hypothetical protein